MQIFNLIRLGVILQAHKSDTHTQKKTKIGQPEWNCSCNSEIISLKQQINADRNGQYFIIRIHLKMDMSDTVSIHASGNQSCHEPLASRHPQIIFWTFL